MPRIARIIPPEGFLHVISRGNNRRTLFLIPKNFEVYRRLLRKLKAKEFIQILHYCLMPNHVHLLVKVEEKSNLSRFMKRLNLQYFYHYRKRGGYAGHLWQGRFKSKLIEEENYLIQCGKYIELNPVRAGIVEQPEDYAYSSYLHHAFGIEDGIVDDGPLYIDLADTPKARQSSYRNMIFSEMAVEKVRLQ